MAAKNLPSTPSKHDCRRWHRQHGIQDFQDFQDFQAFAILQEGMEALLLEAMSAAVLSHLFSHLFSIQSRC